LSSNGVGGAFHPSDLIESSPHRASSPTRPIPRPSHPHPPAHPPLHSFLPPFLPSLFPSQVRRIGERSKALRDEHLRLKTDVPVSSLDPAKAAGPVDGDEVRRKRLLYRSKQRGWLEVDLLLGSWAAQHVPRLTTAELDEYEALLNQETIDIFQIVNGQQPPPPELEGSQVLARLQAYAHSAPFGKASVAGYEAVKDRTNLI
jgi:succinate dehydrogenase assembly factor 2